jgi:hypothetical protein
MTRFCCPECGTERVLRAEHGDDIVSVYCLNHLGGADLHTRPVYMTPVPEPVIEKVALLRRYAGRNGIAAPQGGRGTQTPSAA